ncbi:MAG: hypothetical protein J3R72DRAFT_466148 [Linnemannia gamsii]|nr:MAG: hypothetical protein J3R72DRAFT_466148 [Linnemannia gamsii]
MHLLFLYYHHSISMHYMVFFSLDVCMNHFRFFVTLKLYQCTMSHIFFFLLVCTCIYSFLCYPSSIPMHDLTYHFSLLIVSLLFGVSLVFICLSLSQLFLFCFCFYSLIHTIAHQLIVL